MVHKYVRHSVLGFIIWPKSDDLWHSHIGNQSKRCGGEIISAGFASFADGSVSCYGRSESLDVDSKPEDSAELAKQLGLSAA